ncbi:dna polymerase v-like [Stylonychia lemnae]|uniref:Dna polymerase v-like n=1 Tax=Stylonychia lemnae TaxID=5949 RepID=A0A078AUJ6_STYLE|nr:dna polymerase v-like [Stylonychia lemnae]|eukprot:CDW85691.1 dna polymerase v-like [Stylonychia lemnae]
MEDKEFLDYFRQLGPPSNLDQIKIGAQKIVNTLVAIGTVSGRKGSTDATSKTAEIAEKSLKQKYSTGDLGEKVSADLNYALKRLVRGLNSDNHAVKQGFFLASVMVLNKFKHLIDFEKYLKYVFNETKSSGTMKSSENNNNSIGRMMCISACVEARIFISGSTVYQKSLKVIAGCLAELYSQNEFLQESVAAIIQKMLHLLLDQKQFLLQTIEILMEQLIVRKSDEKAKGGVDIKSTILTDSNKVSLFLRIKEAYLQGISNGMAAGEYADVFNYKILTEKKNLKTISQLIQKQTYLFPRLHTSLQLLLNEINLESKVSDKTKITQQVIISILEESNFNEDVYSQLRSVTKFKFLHIGLRFWQMIAQSIMKWDIKHQSREQLLDLLLSQPFMKVLVKNVQNQKNQLHDAAISVKDTLFQYIQNSNLSGEYALKLVKQLFGPNSLLRFSPKKNQELLKALTTKFEEKQVSDYFEFLNQLYNDTPVEDHYPGTLNNEQNKAEDQDDSDEEEEKPSDENMRKDLIKTFALNQLANYPQIFRTQLIAEHVTKLIEVLARATYFSQQGDKQSQDIQQLGQFKLFGLVQILHKIKIGTLDKGMKNEKDLWISEINSQVQKLSQQYKIKSDLLSYHAECQKFIKEQVSSKRLQLQKQIKKNDEASIKAKAQFKKLIAFEMLFQNLSLLVLIPGEKQVADETKQDIEEMKVVFQKLKITEDTQQNGNKRHKKDSKIDTQQSEALQVLIDFLISLLTKQQSFLREIANFAFKQFCTQITQASLMNMMEIITTPNIEANKMLFDQDDLEANDEEAENDDQIDDDDEEEDESD